MPVPSGPLAKLRGGSLDGKLALVTPPDATVLRCYFSRDDVQWSELYTLLVGSVETDDGDPDLVWPVMVFAERREEDWI